jgi:hypothetical protein
VGTEEGRAKNRDIRLDVVQGKMTVAMCWRQALMIWSLDMDAAKGHTVALCARNKGTGQVSVSFRAVAGK